MDNQHKKIKGYRDLSAKEIALMNRAKTLAEEVGVLCTDILEDPDADNRWASIGRTELQQGFMALIRSVARPTTF